MAKSLGIMTQYDKRSLLAPWALGKIWAGACPLLFATPQFMLRFHADSFVHMYLVMNYQFMERHEIHHQGQVLDRPSGQSRPGTSLPSDRLQLDHSDAGMHCRVEADLKAAGVIKAGSRSQKGILSGILTNITCPCSCAGGPSESGGIQAQACCKSGCICALDGCAQP